MTRAEPGAWGLAGAAVVMMSVLPSAAQPVEPVAAAAADSMQQDGGRLSPRAALVRSAVVPGWGQAASGHWVKALLFAGAGAGWLTSAVVESSRVADAPTPQEHADRAARRNTRVLLYLLTATLAAVDAYVDAHLEDFDLDAGNLESSGVRLTIRWGP